MPRLIPFGEVLHERVTRRRALLTIAGVAAAVAVPSRLGASVVGVDASSFRFQEVPHTVNQGLRVPAGYRASLLLRWGDPVLAPEPEADLADMSPDEQRKRFGYNNDFLAFFPLPGSSDPSGRGVLAVNHEYTNTELMWPGFKSRRDAARSVSPRQVESQMAAHGLSVVEVRRRDGHWQVLRPSPYARRITAGTPMTISGPAAGHPRLQTVEDPTGRLVLGTLANCGGGVTPWGTVLASEENFHAYFGGVPGGREAENGRRYGIEGEPWYAWHRDHRRFDVVQEPNEPNRFGWIVEIDPFDPAARPVKRTALGRFKHEAAATVLAPDGCIVVYSGDDEKFEYVYRFVSAGRYSPGHRSANMRLLDHGTLSVARFESNGTLHWLPLVHGEGPLTRANGFESQADVVIEARRAADLVGATPMDRAEDVEVNPVNGLVYAMFTGNRDRGKEAARAADAANPRPRNRFGHVLEFRPPMTSDGPDHAAHTMKWEIFLLAGDPRDPDHAAYYHPNTSADGWLAAPDNCAFDPQGRLWIATDQDPDRTGSGIGDGLYACDVAGPGRALTRQFLSAPVGAEVAGPAFTPDGTTLFVSIQHPGEGSMFEAPSTRWPDFREDTPPRPSVVAITRDDGGPVGG